MQRKLAGIGLGLLFGACSSGGAASPGGESTMGNIDSSDDGHASTNEETGIDPTPSTECRDVRLTRYTAQELTGCGWNRSLPFMPAFVRVDALTMAMAEPFYGGSRGGEPGESCGECWEITTPSGSTIVMSDNLCPIAGNPLCSDPNQTHFDLSMEAAETLQGGRNDFGAAHPVPCPVEGNIHVTIRDRSWDYFQIVVMNHRIPVHQVEIKPAQRDEWLVARRVFGSVFAVNDATFVAEQNGPGGTVRLTSAQGQTVESTVILGSEQEGETVDLGVQFSNTDGNPGGACSL